MPVTGENNFLSGKKILSIRISSDGLSFWTWTAGKAKYSGHGSGHKADRDININGVNPDATPETRGLTSTDELISALREVKGAVDAEQRIVSVIPDLSVPILIPDEYFDPGKIENYLSFHNMIAREGWVPVISSHANGTVAIINITTMVNQALSSVFGDNFIVISPEQYNLFRLSEQRSKSASAIYLTDNFITVTVQRGKNDILINETFPNESAGDLEYILNTLAGRGMTDRGNISVFKAG